jgi:hypothetical protein
VAASEAVWATGSNQGKQTAGRPSATLCTSPTGGRTKRHLLAALVTRGILSNSLSANYFSASISFTRSYKVPTFGKSFKAFNSFTETELEILFMVENDCSFCYIHCLLFKDIDVPDRLIYGSHEKALFDT